MSFDPGISSPGSIGLYIIFSISLLSTLLVVVLLIRNRSKTASSRLVLLMNLSMAFWTISKLPFTYTGILCQITGFIVSYSVYQILIITYYLLTSTSIASLISNSEIQKTSECRLDYKSMVVIFVIPLLFATFPFSTSTYHESNGWCLLDHNSFFDKVIIVISFLGIWICQLIVLYQLYKVVKKIWDYPSDVFYETVQRVIYGPALYATYTTIIFLFIDIVLVYAIIVNPESNSEGDYYLEYTYAILQYILGIGYAAIYFFERDNLMALETYYKDLEDFEREFGGSIGKLTLDTSRDLTLANGTSVTVGNHQPSSSLSSEFLFPRGSNTEKLLRR